jgi:hypothetical protein
MRITIAPPPGHSFNSSVPFELHVAATGTAVDLIPSSLHFVSAVPRFPHAIPARFRRGEGRITFDVIAYYCDDEESRVCCYQHVRLNLAIEVDERAEASSVDVIHRLGLPEVPPS